MAVNINASNSAGVQITSDTSGVIQFQSAGANTVQIAANGTITNPAGIVVATATGSVSTSGQLLRAPQYFTSGTSYTTPAGCNYLYIEAIGGGGGGGGCGGSGTGNRSGGGGPSRYAVKYVAVSPNTTYSIAIGANGTAGGAAANGTAGGNTTITIGGVTYGVAGGGFGTGVNGGSIGTSGASGTAINMDYDITPTATTGPAPSVAAVGGVINLPFIGFNTTASTPTYQSQGYGAGGPGQAGVSLAGFPGVQGALRIWEYS